MKKLVFISLAFVFISTNLLLSNLEHPNSSECQGMTFRLTENYWNQFGIRSSWNLRNADYDDGELIWANWKCENPGGGCRRGDWATRWNIMIENPGEGWTETYQIETGEFTYEPPLPPEQGYWINVYPPNCPENYDETTGMYY